MYGNPMLGAAQNFSPAAMYGTTANMQQGLGAQIFQPESQYNAQLITANRKEAMDAQIANAQASNARMNGLMSMAGTIGGAFLGNPALGSLLGGAAGKTGSAVSAASGLGASMPSLSTSQLAGGFSSSIGGGGLSNIGSFTSPAMYTFPPAAPASAGWFGGKY
jgi:hypothetical protein